MCQGRPGSLYHNGNRKKIKNYVFFLPTVQKRAMAPVIPAIAQIGERGTLVGIGEVAAGAGLVGTGVSVAVPFTERLDAGVAGTATMRLWSSPFFIEGLLTMTRYCPGSISTWNPYWKYPVALTGDMNV